MGSEKLTKAQGLLLIDLVENSPQAVMNEYLPGKALRRMGFAVNGGPNRFGKIILEATEAGRAALREATDD